MGFIEPSSFHEIDIFVRQLPALLVDARQKRYSPQLLRDFILEKLDGGKLRLLMCTSCKAKLFVDKSPKYSLVSVCPVCVSGVLEVAKDEAKILKTALNAGKPKQSAPGRIDSGDAVIKLNPGKM
jgi:hypothetical protein